LRRERPPLFLSELVHIIDITAFRVLELRRA
jgi:hypothetical protein